MRKTVSIEIAAVIVLLTIGGCSNVKSDAGKVSLFQPQPLINEVFTVEGIPHQKYMVGGGFAVEFKAPCAGTLFWVEQTERRIMMTKQLQEGQTFEEYVPVDQEEFRLLFRHLDKTRFVLYFVPAQPTDQ